MKTFRLRFLQAIAFLIVGHVFLYPVLCALLLGWDGEQLAGLMLEPAHFVNVLLSLATAWGIFTFRPWAATAFNFYLAGVAGESLMLARRLGKLEHIPVSLPLILAALLSVLLYGASKVRKGSRERVHLPIEIRSASDDPPAIEGRTLDLSEHGCSVQLPSDTVPAFLTAGADVRLRLGEGGTESMRLNGKVISFEGGLCRLKFVRLTFNQVEFIRAELKRGTAKT